MYNIRTGRTLRSLRRAVFFSFVTAPSLALFVAFGFLSFNNSLAGTFLEEARGLVAGTPADKVRVCAPPLNTAGEGRVPPPVLKPLCEPVLTDASDWQRSTDSSIRGAYKILVILGAFTWWLCNGIAGFEDTARWLKGKAMMINAVRRSVQGGKNKHYKE
ncbi:hypothetical protein [Kosakonia radicincitans]|uniref:hypothetical protein n=1 Tax=Kosakonia radicincitans TaxID=283686 RepID=UPI002367EEB0|nr:hypothetical protein [Kosakonia radicincitans]MDD7997501.1 hypothetical protein [Kosakonia radicincitans]